MFKTPPQAQDEMHEYSKSSVSILKQICKPIIFSPCYYDYALKQQRKSRLLYIDSSEHLPRVLLSEKLAQKASFHQLQKVNKKAFGLTNQVLNKGTICFDGLSYDTQDGYENKLVNDDLYGCLVQFIFEKFDAGQILQSLNDHLQTNANVYQNNNLDLIYLNQFKIAVFIQEGDNKCFKLTSILYYPQLGFEVCEIKQPNKLVETPLTRMITRLKKGKSEESQKQTKAQYKFGFLTLDQSKRILPLMASDPIVFQLPLIGAWLYTNDQNEDILSKTQLIYTIITEFVTGNNFKSKITNSQQEKGFLFVLFQKYKSPIFFDTKVLNQPKSNTWRLLKQIDQVSQEEIGNHIINFNNAQTLKVSTSQDLLQSHQELKLSIERRCKTQISPTLMQSPQWADTHQKCPPQPTPQALFNDTDTNTNNTSVTSATFMQKSQNVNQSQSSHSTTDKEHSLTQQLIQMQAEQLKMLQSQVLDLQKALINQSQQQQSFHQPTPSMYQNSQQYYYSPFYQKYSEPMIQPSQSQFNRVSITAFPQILSNRSNINSDSSGKLKQTLIAIKKFSPQSDLIHQTFSNLPQKLDFFQNEQIKSLKKHTDGEIEDLVKIIVGEEIKSSEKKVIAQQKQSPKKGSQKKEIKNLNNLIFSKQKTEGSSQPNQKMNTLVSANKENIQKLINSGVKILQESAQSKIPKIKCIMNTYNEDSDSDAEIQKLQIKYLKKMNKKH